MVQIKTFPLTRLLDGAIAEFHNAFIPIVLAYDLNKLSIHSIFPKYEVSVEKLNKAISKSPRLANTQKIAKADAYRDRVIKRFFKLVKDMRKSPIPEENAAGTTLWNAVSPYDGVAGYELNKETALVKDMLYELQKPKATEAIRALNLYNTVTQIGQYNNEVEALMAERVETESGIEKINTLEQRKEANALYTEVVQYINATAILNFDADIDELVERTNALIEEYRRVISRMQPGGTGNEKGGKKKKVEITEQIKNNEE